VFLSFVVDIMSFILLFWW